MFGAGLTDTTADEWPERYGIYLPDMVTPFPADELPLARALRGEIVDDVEVFVRPAHAPENIWTRITGRPLRDNGGMLKGGGVVCRDITGRKRAEEELREAKKRRRSRYPRQE